MSAPQTTAVVNADIATKVAASPDVSVTVTAPGAVTGGGFVSVNPAGAGKGDGKITFSNAGDIGVVTAGAVTDSVGVSLNGAGATATGNTATVANSKQITGGLSVQNFGSDVTVANSGSIYGFGIIANGSKNVTVDSTGNVLAGAVTANAISQNKVTVDGATTTSVSNANGGNSAVSIEGNVANADASVRGNVSAFSSANSSVKIGTTTASTAGAIQANAFTPTTTVTTTKAPVDSATTTTFDSATTAGKSNAAVTIGAKADVTSVSAFATTTSTVDVAGKVAGGVTAGSNSTANTTAKNTVTRDAVGNTGTTSSSTSETVGAASTANIASGATVGGSVFANGITSGSASNDGEVTGGLFATASGTKSDSSTVTTNDSAAGGAILTSKTVSNSAANGGAAKVAVGATGVVGGSISATGDSGATATIAGNVKGGTTVTSNGTSTNTVTTSADKGLTTTSLVTKAPTGGAVSIDIASGGTAAGSVIANGDTSAKITNAGTIGVAGSPLVAANAQSQRTYVASSQSDFKSATSADGLTTTLATNNVTQTKTAGGTASVANAGSGIVFANIASTAAGDVGLQNSGLVLGTTTGTSAGTTSTTGTTVDNTVVTTKVAAPGFDVNTTTSKVVNTAASTNTGGSVTGDFSGVNGTKNFGGVGTNFNGSVSQNAAKDSTATVSGAVYGNLSSSAGQATDTTSTKTTTTKLVQDVSGTPSGTNAVSVATSTTSKQVAGASTVTVTGAVDSGTSGLAGSVNSFGTSASTVKVSGTGYVAGGVQSIASGVSSSATDSTSALAQTQTKGVNATDTLATTSDSKTTVTGGAASLDLSGTAVAAKNGGTVFVSGVSGATAGVASAAAVGSKTSTANLFVNATSGSDTSSSTTQNYARDAKTGIVTASDVSTFTSAPSAAQGSASATVAGSVYGQTSVSAGRGDATVSLTGVSRDGVFATSGASTSTSTTKNEYTGKAAASAATAYGALPKPTGAAVGDVVTTTSSSATTNLGGKASITIDTAAALQTAGTLAVQSGSVSANGLGGASVSVTKGSVVGSIAVPVPVFATSQATDSTSQFVNTNTVGVINQTSTNTSTTVGGAAAITNAGTITGSAVAQGNTSASVANTGKIAGSANATAIGSTFNQSIVDTNVQNVSLRNQVTTNTFGATGGDAKVSNTAGSVISGGASVAGKTGSVTNAGYINGTIAVGQAVQNYKTETTLKAGTTTQAVTAPTTLFGQTYTVDQNGFSRGVTVTGATVTDPTDATKTIKTSAITATVNLNSGSATLGSIIAETDKAGVRQTATTVNLNGSGFLGADAVVTPSTAPATIKTLPTPYLTLTQEAIDAGFTGGSTVVVRGVETLNKTGTGTFVINGSKYIAAKDGAPAQFTLDVGNFNVNAGEVQITTPAAAFGSPVNEFGIKGNVNNSATLVLGRRVQSGVQQVGDSLVGVGPVRIVGTTVRQEGNFTQAASGTLVVGITPSLVRFGQVTVNNGSGAGEPLGPVSSGVSIPYFTTPVNAAALAAISAPSRVNITGNLNLAGTVAVDVTRDGIFANNDGYTLFTYTGTGTVTATATSSIVSPFVKFNLVNDATAKTVRVNVARSSYAAGATNTNAQAAAVALDSAIPSIISRITSDANGGAAFTSVSQIGYAQDLANIVSALDFRLNATQAAQVFDELSSAEIYGSLASVDQNAAFGQSLDMAVHRRSTGAGTSTRLWINPVGNFARYGGGNNGASRIRSNAFGGAIGLDLAYSDTGVFGIGGGYTEHDINARGTAESADGKTWTLGFYGSQAFGSTYASLKVAYGFSKFDTQRELTLLDRTIEADFKAKQLDASLEVGHDFDLGSATVTPFGKVALRKFRFSGFTEEGGAGVGLIVGKVSDTVFLPTLGAKIAGQLGDEGGLVLRPYGKVSYTFQGGLENARLV